MSDIVARFIFLIRVEANGLKLRWHVIRWKRLRYRAGEHYLNVKRKRDRNEDLAKEALDRWGE